MTSQTHETADLLRTLHRMHKQLRDLKERLDRGPRLVRARQANLKKLEEQLAEIKSQTVKLRCQIDEKNNQLAGREEAVKRRRRQLQQASSNTEYQALKDQIASDEAANGALEVEILDRMEKQDALQEQWAAAEQAVARAQKAVEQSREEVDEQAPRIQNEIQRIQAERTRCEDSLPGDFHSLYSRVVGAKGEDALAAVRGEFCGGCNQHVPVNEINAMLLGEARTCRSCGRLLYLPENYSP